MPVRNRGLQTLKMPLLYTDPPMPAVHMKLAVESAEGADTLMTAKGKKPCRDGTTAKGSNRCFADRRSVCSRLVAAF